MDPKSKVEVGTMSEEELGDALAYEPEIRPRREVDFDEFGVERSTGYSLEVNHSSIHLQSTRPQ